jgi:hypothetical protein
MLTAYLQTLQQRPTAKTRLHNLYLAYNRDTGSLCHAARFLNRLSHIGVRVQGRFILGYTLPTNPVADIPARLPPKPQRSDVIPLCPTCGGPVHPCYSRGPAARAPCENCEVDFWAGRGIRGAMHGHTKNRKEYNDG